MEETETDLNAQSTNMMQRAFLRREAEQRNYPDLLEQLRNDVNSSNLIENGENGEDDDSSPSDE